MDKVARGESDVGILRLRSNFNERFGDIRRNAAKSVLPPPAFAASALWPKINVGKVRVFHVLLGHSENTVSVPVETMAANDRSDDNCCNAEHHLLRVRKNAASAIAAPA